MDNRLPVGPGSRGGRWHDPEYRRAYHRAWRAAHPEYRERERLRRARARGHDVPQGFPRPLPMADSGVICQCGACGCQNRIAVLLCGMCYVGMHAD